MKFRIWMTTPVVCLVTALAMPLGIFAQENNALNRKAKHHTYKLIDLGTFGGPNSDIQGPLAQVLNNRGAVSGGADTAIPDPSKPCFNPFDRSDCFVEHAFKWRDGILTDLGTLSGGLFSYPLWINDRGVVAGSSENGFVDPLTGAPETRAVVWANEEATDLGTLGGNQSGAIDVNNLDQVIGFALNATPDDALPLSEIVGAGAAATECRAFLWQKGKMYDLGTLGGPDAFAQFVNDRGQVAGFSYTSSTVDPNTGIPPIHAFLWDHRMIDLGTFGGAFALVDDLNNLGQVVGPMDLAGDLTFHPFLWDRGILKDLGTLGGDNGEAFWINDAGEAVGNADLSGPEPQLHHAFLWKHGTMMDLGTVDGDSCSVAMFISSQGQITGSSTNCSGYLHAFLWENGGPMVDLNSLVHPGSPLRVREGDDINERGEIAGKAVLPNGDLHAVLLVPDGDCEDECEARIAAKENSAAATAQINLTSRGTGRNGETEGTPIHSLRNRFAQKYHVPGQRTVPLN